MYFSAWGQGGSKKDSVNRMPFFWAAGANLAGWLTATQTLKSVTFLLKFPVPHWQAIQQVAGAAADISLPAEGSPTFTRGLQAVRRSVSAPPALDRAPRAPGGSAMSSTKSQKREWLSTPLAPKPEPAPPGPVKIGHRATATTAKNLLRTRLGDASAGTHVHCTVRNFLGRGQKSGWLAKHPVDGIFFGLPLIRRRN